MNKNNDDLLNNVELNDDVLESVKGGSTIKGGKASSYQLTFKGISLNMNVILSTLVETIPEIRGIFGDKYNSYKNYTLNQLCAAYGQSTIQNYFNDYSREGK